MSIIRTGIAVLLALSIVGGLLVTRWLLREGPPTPGASQPSPPLVCPPLQTDEASRYLDAPPGPEGPLTATLFWTPVSTDGGRERYFAQGGKALAVRVRNGSDAPAKVAGLTTRRRAGDARPLDITTGLAIEAGLWDRSGRPVVDRNPAIRCCMPTSSFTAASILSENPPLYELAAGQSLDLPFDPFPSNVVATETAPGVYWVVAVLTWLDADAAERRRVRSSPLPFDFTADDIAKLKAEDDLESERFRRNTRSTAK